MVWDKNQHSVYSALDWWHIITHLRSCKNIIVLPAVLTLPCHIIFLFSFHHGYFCRATSNPPWWEQSSLSSFTNKCGPPWPTEYPVFHNRKYKRISSNDARQTPEHVKDWAITADFRCLDHQMSMKHWHGRRLIWQLLRLMSIASAISELIM